MLASSYKFYADNQLDGVLTVDLTITPWKFNTTTGALEYGTPIARQVASLAQATGGDIGAAIDNSSDLYLGAHIDCAFTTTGTGDCYVYMFTGTGSEPTMLLVAATNPETLGIFNAEI